MILILAVIAAMRAEPALAQAAAGSVTTVSGQVEVQRGTSTITATGGMTIEVGDRIMTGANGHIVVTLTDGSTLELGDSSTIAIDQHSGAPLATRVSLFAGVLRSLVNKTVGAAAPNFEVHTPNAVAAVRGTRFDTAYSAGVARPTFGDCRAFTDVSVFDGLVGLANVNALNAGIEVPAGYESTVPCTLAPTGAGPLGMTGASSLGTTAVSTVLTPVAPVPPPVCGCPPGEVPAPPGPPPPPPPPPSPPPD